MGVQFVIYSTHSHDPVNQDYCYRVIVPFSRPVLTEDYTDVYWNSINNNLKLKQLSDEGLMDHKAQENTRGFFAPSCHPDRKDDAYMNTFGGVPLEPDTTKNIQANNLSSNNLDVKTSMSDLMKGVGEGDRHKSCTRLSGLLFSKGFSYGDVVQLILGIKMRIFHIRKSWNFL